MPPKGSKKEKVGSSKPPPTVAPSMSTRATRARSKSQEPTVPPSPSKSNTLRKSSRTTRGTSTGTEPAAPPPSRSLRSSSKELPKDELFGLDDPEKALKQARKRGAASRTPSRATTPDVELLADQEQTEQDIGDEAQASASIEINKVTSRPSTPTHHPHELSTIREESEYASSAIHPSSIDFSLADELDRGNVYQSTPRMTPPSSRDPTTSQNDLDPSMSLQCSLGSQSFSGQKARLQTAFGFPTPYHVIIPRSQEDWIVFQNRRDNTYEMYCKHVDTLNYTMQELVDRDSKSIPEPQAHLSLSNRLQNLRQKLAVVSHDPAMTYHADELAEAKYKLHSITESIIKSEEFVANRQEVEEQHRARIDGWCEKSTTETQGVGGEVTVEEYIEEYEVRQEVGEVVRDDDEFMDEDLVQEGVAETDDKEEYIVEEEAVDNNAMEVDELAPIVPGITAARPITPTNTVHFGQAQTEERRGWLSSLNPKRIFNVFGSFTQPAKKTAAAPDQDRSDLSSPTLQAPQTEPRPRYRATAVSRQKQAIPNGSNTQSRNTMSAAEGNENATPRTHKRPDLRTPSGKKIPFWTNRNIGTQQAKFAAQQEQNELRARNMLPPLTPKERLEKEDIEATQVALVAHLTRHQRPQSEEVTVTPPAPYTPAQLAGVKRSAPQASVEDDAEQINEDTLRSSKRTRLEESPTPEGSPTPKAKSNESPSSGRLFASSTSSRPSRSSPSRRTFFTPRSARAPILQPLGYNSPTPGDPNFRRVNEDIMEGTEPTGYSVGKTFEVPDFDTTIMSNSSAGSHASRRVQDDRNSRSPTPTVKKVTIGLLGYSETNGGATYGLDDDFYDEDTTLSITEGDGDDSESLAPQAQVQNPSLSATPSSGSKRKYTEADLEAKAAELERKEAELQEREEAIAKRQRLNTPTSADPQWTQSPPPPPSPSHARLPSSAPSTPATHGSAKNGFTATHGTATDGRNGRLEEAIAAQKAKAARFAPKTPSGLRDVSRYSSPASEITAEISPPDSPKLAMDPQFLASLLPEPRIIPSVFGRRNVIGQVDCGGVLAAMHAEFDGKVVF